MISPIDSRSYSPVSIHVPQQINEVQDSSISSSSTKKAGRIRTGVAEYNDSFEQANVNKADQLKELNQKEFMLEVREKDKWSVEYKKIIEKQKAEQAKAYRPDQQGVTLHPSITPTANVSLAADLSANMLSMIRV